MKTHFYSFVLFIAVLSLASCGNKQGGAQQAGAPTGPAPVNTVKIPTSDVTTFKDYPTSIEGIINSDARPKITGYITDVYVDEGQKVKKGQLLFKLETESLTEEAEAAKANINAAQVQVDQLKPLVEKKIVSANQLATAEARLSQAKASYQSIMANIGYAIVRSPVDGYVGTIRIRRGNLVSPNDPRPLTTITDINQVYAYFSMNEKDYLDFLKTAEGETRIEKIENMPEVTLIMANGEEFKHKGTIQTVNSQIGKESGSVSFRAVFDNPEQILTNGSTGTIKVPNLHENILVVPQNSTFERQGRTYVLSVQKDDGNTVAVQKAIDIADAKDNLYLVQGGIQEGEEIVVEGVDRIRSQTPIKPMEQPFDSVAKPIKTVFKE